MMKRRSRSRAHRFRRTFAARPTRFVALPTRGSELPTRFVESSTRGSTRPTRGSGSPTRFVPVSTHGSKPPTRFATFPTRSTPLSTRGSELLTHGSESSTHGSETPRTTTRPSHRGALRRAPAPPGPRPPGGRPLLLTGIPRPVRSALRGLTPWPPLHFVERGNVTEAILPNLEDFDLWALPLHEVERERG